MDIHQFLAEHDIDFRKQEEAVASASKEATAVFKKHFPDDGNDLDAPRVLAACLELFDLEDPKDAGQLYLEWLIEHYVGRKVAANIDDIKVIVEALKAKGFTEDNPYDYNDCDNRLFYIPHEEKLIFCVETQNTRYIYILDGRKFHVRRYYDEYDFDGKKDKWELREVAVYNRKGIRHAISNAFWLSEQWSDCVDGNQYIVRPSLQYFKNCDFNLRYNDCRDAGYVLSFENLFNPRADGAAYHYTEIKSAFFQLRCTVREVAEFGA